MRARSWWALAGLLAACGPTTEAFTCEGDAQCLDGVRAGACEASGFCSFPDASCPSHKRYGEYAAEDLAGACVDVPAPLECDAPCGPCMTCEDGVCVQAAAGTACTVACADLVFGVQTEGTARSCLAFAPGDGAGACDDAGACTPGDGACVDPGAAIAECDADCARKDHNCDPGAKVAAVTPATLCETMTETGGCHSGCMNVSNQPSVFTPQQCDADGRCVAEPATDCGPYTCAGQDCRTDCAKQGDCAPMANCDMMTNMCQ